MKSLTLFATVICISLPAWAIPVSVSVVGPDGKPLPAATLEVRQGDGSSIYGNGALQPLAAPIAGSAGQWSFDWDGKFLAQGAPIEERFEAKAVLWARISAPGMATQTRQLEKSTTTVHLTAGRAWSGVVRDQNEKPVEGVRVKLKGWTLNLGDTEDAVIPDAQRGSFNPVGTTWIVEATTDAAGRWQMDELPQRGWAIVGLSKLPYASATFNLDLKDDSAPPLFVKAGASVAGQVVAPDGKPLVGQLVVAGWNADPEMQTRTDTQGRFSIGGLGAGQTFLSPHDFFAGDKEPESKYLLAQRDMVEVRAGETTDTGQWKAQTGTMVKMRVVDAVTGKPIEGAQFNSFRQGDLAKSDAKGAVQARVIRDDSNYPSLGSVSTENYLSYQIPRPAKMTEGGALDLGTIKLERGSIVTGSVRVAGETNVADLPTLSFQMGGAGNAQYVNLGDDGKTFKTSTMKPGIYSVYAYKSWGSEPSKDWEVVSPKRLTVPAPGVVSKPVEIVFKRLKPAKAVVSIQAARGRLVDAQGQGVAGAVVLGQFVAGYNSSGAQAVTDANGDWSAQTALNATEFKFKGIERPGYNKVGAEKIVVKDGVATVSNISLKRRGAPFAGRVINADGTAAGGAWIAVLEDRYYAPIRADESGRFALADLSLAEFTLLAGKGANWARIETTTDAKNSEIKLRAPAAFERDAAIQEALTGKAEWYRAENYWDVLGWERMGELVARDEDKNGWSNYQFALQLAEREPAIFLERAPALIEAVSEKYGYKTEVSARWRLVQAAQGDADAKIEANNWVDEQKAEKKAVDAASVTQLLRVAAVAGKLGRTDAEDLSDYAAALANQVTSSDQADSWGKALGQSGYAATQRFVDGLKPIAEFNVWKAATSGIAKGGDVAGTRAAIARMEALAATPEWVEKARKESWNNPVNQIEYIRIEAARSLSETDMPAALALIESLDDSDYSKSRAAHTIADRAIAAGDVAAAEKMLRGAMKNNISNAEGFALSASLAERVSPQLGAELWAEALKRALPPRTNEDFGARFAPSVAMWAFYYARLDAAQSRVLIEREWNWRLPRALKLKDGDEYGEEAFNLDRLEMAMSAFDPARALEMRAQVARESGKPAKANVGMAATLLSSEAQRARFGVDNRF